MGRKSRHYRDESDQLLGIYSDQIAATTSIRSYGNPVHVPTDNHYNNYNYNYINKNKNSNSNSTVSGGGNHNNNNDNNNNNTNPLDSIRNLSPSNLFFSQQKANHHRKDSHDIDDSLSVLSFPNQNNNSNNIDGKNENCNSDNNDNSMNEATPPSHKNNNKIKQQKKKRKSGDHYKVHRVSYTAQNHVQVIFQMYGSAFPQVFPFCLSNFLWTLLVAMLKHHDIIDLTFHSSIGHSFMGLLVSFLIVSRSKISYDRFMEFRRHLATSYRTCREMAQLVTVYTFSTQTQQAKEWRSEVCYRTVLLLRVTMDALLWSSTEREQWEGQYFQYKIAQDAHRSQQQDVSEHFFQFRSLSHGRRSNIDENFRAPISFAHVLRQVIMQHPEYLGYTMPVNEYRDLVLIVEKYLEAFHGFRTLIFTPYPFPLVQMTRAFLFFWVYSLPLVLLKDYRIISSLVIVILVTFGFIGVEYVSMALDDPFGDDTNDVDEHGMALLVYEDIYMAIYRTDGPEEAIKLRERILARYRQGRELDCYRDDLKGYEFWDPYNRYSSRNKRNNSNTNSNNDDNNSNILPPSSLQNEKRGGDYIKYDNIGSSSSNNNNNNKDHEYASNIV